MSGTLGGRSAPGQVSNILVTGGTGQLGRRLVSRLAAAGHAVRVLTRRERPDLAPGVTAVRGDLTTGHGLEDATSGIDVIYHCASGTGTARGLTYRSAKKTDVTATARLLTVAKGFGEPRVIYISIVGIDRIPLGYYHAKLETEHVVEASGLPFAILRTTQWHTLAVELCARFARMPVALVPRGVRMQLLDPDEVAERMVELLSFDRNGHAPEMGGPAPLDLIDVFGTYLRTLGKKKPALTVRVPGKAMAGFRAGYNLTPDHADGRVTWPDWLAAHAIT